MAKPTDVSNQVIDQFLSKTMEYLSSAEAFLKAEVPVFVQEFMAWNFYEALFFLVVCLILFSIGFTIALSCHKKNSKLKYDNDGNVVGIVFGWVLSSVMVLFIIGFIHTMIKIKVAPRVFLLEQVKYLTK